jgi:hypothetical protein
MDTTTEVPVRRLIGIEGLGDLFRVLVSEGYQVIGPAVQDGAIVLRELWSATRTPDEFDVDADDHEPPRYAGRRDGVFIVAVNCTEPGETCFCASMNAGPGAGPGFDLALTELLGESGHRFLLDVSSEAGADLITRVDSERADDATVRRARSAVDAAADRMGRQLDTGGLRELMAGSHDAAHTGTRSPPAA